MDDTQQSPIERASQLLNQGIAVIKPADHQKSPVASSTITGSADHEPGVASEDTTMDWNVDDSDVNTEFTQERFEAMTNFEFPDTDGAGMFSPDFFNTTDLESMTGALATAESSTPDSMSIAQPEMDTATTDPNVNMLSPAAPSALLTPAPPTHSHGNCTPSATPEAVDDGVDLIPRRCMACKKQKRRCTGGIPCDLCSHRGKTADECEEDVNYKRRKKADLRKTPAPEKIKKTPKANKDGKEVPAPSTAGTSASAEPAAQNSASAAGNDKQPSNDRSTTPEGTPQPPSMLPLQSPAPTSASADDTQKPAPKKRAATPKKAPGEKKAAATPKEKKTPAPKERKTPTPRKRPTKAEQPKGTGAAPIKGSGLRNEIFPSETITPSNSAHETPPTSSSSQQQQHARALSDGPPPTPHPDADYIDVSNLLNPAASAFARSPHAASPAALTSFSRFIEASRQALASDPALMPADTRARLSASAGPTLAAILADDDNETAAPQPQHSPQATSQDIALPARIPSTSIVAAKRSAAAPAGPAPKRLRGGESPLAATLRDGAFAPQEGAPGLALSAAEWRAVVAYGPGVDGGTYARLTRYEAVLAEAERYHVWHARTLGAEGEVAYGVPSPGHGTRE
ncbi:hypothetical protein SLS56_003611 [Neofusicoccum ribis]|uniref:Zn(2)-C6 fungal-type domain-containing protein n=1 Tax=Neofusicoccum ribis TaxID=45134 RepID=A0ABR3SYV7_9PEZI